MRGFNVWHGINAVGTVTVGGAGSTLTVTYRPTRGSAFWIAFSAMITVGVAWAAWDSAVEGRFE